MKKVTYSDEDINQVLNALAQLPYNASAPIIDILQKKCKIEEVEEVEEKKEEVEEVVIEEAEEVVQAS